MTDRSLRAYYYAFTTTGNKAIDDILRAVAAAGGASHSTSQWTDPVGFEYKGLPSNKAPVEWIQDAANAAAEQFNELARSGVTIPRRR